MIRLKFNGGRVGKPEVLDGADGGESPLPP